MLDKKFVLVATALLSFGLSFAEKIIHITPGSFGNIFNTNVKIGNAQISCYRLREALKKMGYSLQQGGSFRHLKDPEYIVFFDMSGSVNDLKKYPREKRVLFLWEPPTTKPSGYYKKNHEPFGTIFTWDDTLVDNKKYFKYHYPQPTLEIIDPVPNFDEKKLCVLIACNKGSSHPNQIYTERKKAIDFLAQEAADDFDLYGIGWSKQTYPMYKGYVKDKIKTLSQYKFCICYENMRDTHGYITEKIFDCLVAGCVPIYWGSANITDYVSADCFIDRRDFDSIDEVYEYIKDMSCEEYEQYIENIRGYLQSDLAYKFSSDYFIENFISVLNLQ